MGRGKRILIFWMLFGLVGMGLSDSVSACTSVIVSGRVRSDGRPLMMKHRDTGFLDNRMEWFRGEKYAFIGLVNSDSTGGEIWAGNNEAGFCIMNTATYDLKDDEVPSDKMDREGILMYRALEICRNLEDFEHFLDTLSRPMGVEANFGVMDADGGAAYYETNNHSWTKFDVNEMDSGYRVVTNFTETGRPDDRKGVDRFCKASEIMAAAPESADGKLDIDAMWLMNHLSRSGAPILRDITSATVVFSGVAPGNDPMHTVMWTALGYPETTITLPLMVLDENHLPFFTQSSEGSLHAEICDNALKFKGSDKKVERDRIEKSIVSKFEEIYSKWTFGGLDMNKFEDKYDRFMDEVYQLYCNDFLKE